MMSEKFDYVYHLISEMCMCLLLGDKILSVHGKKSYEVQELGVLSPGEMSMPALWVIAHVYIQDEKLMDYFKRDVNMLAKYM